MVHGEPCRKLHRLNDEVRWGEAPITRQIGIGVGTKGPCLRQAEGSVYQ